MWDQAILTEKELSTTSMIFIGIGVRRLRTQRRSRRFNARL